MGTAAIQVQGQHILMTVPCSHYILDITQYDYKSFPAILGKTSELFQIKQESTLNYGPAIL